MKIKIFTLLNIFIFTLLTSQAQILISPSQSVVCPNEVITLKASLLDPQSVQHMEDAFGEVINIGFPFEFYGETFSQFVISSNNFISFDLSLRNQASYFQYDAAIQNQQLNKVIMFPFQDLDLTLNQGFIRHQLIGSAPFRKLVIEFCQIPLWGCFNLPTTTSQLILYEGTNIIEMFVKTKPGNCIWWDGTGVQGLRSKQGGVILEDLVSGRNQPNKSWTVTNDGKRFIPKGRNSYSITGIPFEPVPLIVNPNATFIKWYAEGNSNPIASGSSVNIVADPNNIRYYVAQITGEICSEEGNFSFSDTSWVEKTISRDTVIVTQCGGTYNFYGRQLDQSGVYDSFFMSSGCKDSIVRLQLVIHLIDTQTISTNYNVCGPFSFEGVTYTSSTILKDTILNQWGCDSIYKNTNIVIGQSSVPDTLNAFICNGQKFEFNGISYTSSAMVTHVFSNSQKCDSSVTLNLTVGAFISKFLDVKICKGTQFKFNGSTYSSPVLASQMVNDTLAGANGCDTIVTLILQVAPYLKGIHEVSICQGNSIVFNGVSYSSSVTLAMGITDTLKNSAGCDSIVSLILNVQPYKAGILYASICQGQSFLFNGSSFDSSVSLNMEVTDTLLSPEGCDSIVSLILEVQPAKIGIFNTTICQGQSAIYDGRLYTKAISFYDTIKTNMNCDSIVYVTISVIPFLSSILDVAICAGDTFVFNNESYTSTVPLSQNVQDTFKIFGGCDSIVTLNLLVKEYQTSIVEKTICQGDKWDILGISYSQPVIISDTVASLQGCDMIITYILKVSPPSNFVLKETICSGENYVFNQISYTASVPENQGVRDTFKTSLGCDSIVTLNLIVKPSALMVSDTVKGCGSVHLNGMDFYSSQYLNDTFKFSNTNCDSIYRSRYIQVNPFDPSTQVVHLKGCGSILFKGLKYTRSTSFRDTLINQLGCDSVWREINIVVYDSISDQILNVSLCRGQKYSFNGIQYSVNTSVIHTFSSVNGCDSTVTLNLTFSDFISNDLKVSICQGEVYTFKGIKYTSSVRFSDQVKDTFITSGGCDSIVSLVLTVNPYVKKTITHTICQGGIITFNGINYTTPISLLDDIKDTILSKSQSCDTIITLVLNVNPYLTGIQKETICAGSKFLFHGIHYNTSQPLSNGIKDTIKNADGCDSIVSLHLTVTPYPVSILEATICQGDSFKFKGILYSQSVALSSGIQDTIKNLFGCDSIVKFQLHVNPVQTTILNASMCVGSLFYFNSKHLFEKGTYLDTLVSSTGCDSFIVLHLHVDTVLISPFHLNLCSGSFYYFGGLKLTKSGIYYDKYRGTSGCDSIVQLYLTVVEPVIDTIEANICEGGKYQLGNQALFNSGRYIDTLTALSGCDSIVLLNLTVHPTQNTFLKETICKGESFFFQQQDLITSGIYRDTFKNVRGCDSIVILTLEVMSIDTTHLQAKICPGTSYSFFGQNINSSGIYQKVLPSALGCDSLIQMNLTVLPASVVSLDTLEGCWSISYKGIVYSVSTLITDAFSFTGMNCDSARHHTFLQIHQPDTQSVYLNYSGCGQVQYEGVNYTSSVLLKDTIVNQFYCDSIYRFIQISVFPAQQPTVLTATICHGSTYNFNNQTYTQSGTTSMTLKNSNNCDSVVQLILTVNPPAKLVYDTISACWSTNYQGRAYSSNTIITDTLTSQIWGCDSVYRNTFILIHPEDTQSVVLNFEGCNEYIFEGTTYYQSTNFQDAILNQFQCDSIYRDIKITIYQIPLIVINIDTIGCGRVVFEERSYYQNDTLTTVYKNILGCDSLIHNVRINVNDIIYDTLNAEICAGESFEYNGKTYSEEGEYPFLFKSVRGCDSVMTLKLGIRPLPQLEIYQSSGPNELCMGDEIIFQGRGGISYHWFSQDKTYLGEGAEMKIKLPKDENAIFLKGNNEWNCSDTAKFVISANACCDYFVPNAFSPNNDGLNDIFKVETNGHPYGFQLLIFNRLGQKVFQSLNFTKGWDGTFNGQPLNNGVFHYILNGKCANGKDFKQKGVITLIR